MESGSQYRISRAWRLTRVDSKTRIDNQGHRLLPSAVSEFLQHPLFFILNPTVYDDHDTNSGLTEASLPAPHGIDDASDSTSAMNLLADHELQSRSTATLSIRNIVRS